MAKSLWSLRRTTLAVLLAVATILLLKPVDAQVAQLAQGEPSQAGASPLQPFPASAEITAAPLDSARQTLRTQLYYPSQRADFKEREETREKLCGSVIHRPDSSPNAVKAALTVAEADMNADVLFEKGKGEGADTPG
jgi:hypothetical protein